MRNKFIEFIFIILISTCFLPICAQANVVSDSISSIIQKKNQNTQENLKIFNAKKFEKYHRFDSVNQKYAFVVFYESTCPHCQKFIPILYQFSKNFGFHVYAYTVNGGVLPEFPHSMIATQNIERVFFSSPAIEVPTLFMMNVKTMRAYRINQGEISYSDLQNKVNAFFQNEVFVK